MRNRLTVTAKDLRAMVALLDADRPAIADEELPSSLLAELAALVPCSFVSFNLIDAFHHEDRGQSCSISDTDPYDVMAPDVAEELDQLFWSGYWAEGGCSYVERTGDRTSVLRASDGISARDFAKTTMGEFYRRTGVRHEVMVSLPPLGAYERRLMLVRTSGRDFSDREVLLLTLLRPHLVTAHQRQRRRRNGVAELTPRQWEILRFVAAGSTNTEIARRLTLSEATVRKHLENVYERLGVGTRTAALTQVAPLMDLA